MPNNNNRLDLSGLSYLWIKLKAIFSNKADRSDTVLDTTLSRGRQANTTVGTGSFAFGYEVTASNQYSHAEGGLTTASGVYSHAEGNDTSATADSAHAEGYESSASGIYSHAEGHYTQAKAVASHAEGDGTIANKSYSHAEGYHTTSDGIGAHAEGNGTYANGDYSHAEGNVTNADGDHSHAEGYATNATGDQSHAEGNTTTSSGNNSHAEGLNSVASGTSSHAEGEATRAISAPSHAEGLNTYAAAIGSHAEGVGYSSNSTDYGALGYASHAEGRRTKATSPNNGLGGAHAEGHDTLANGDGAHAEGGYTKANGADAHAEGSGTIASGSCAHAEGYNSFYGDGAKKTYNYYATFNRALTLNGRMTSSSTTSIQPSAATRTHIEGYETSANSAPGSHAEGYETHAEGGYGVHSEGYQTCAAGGNGNHAEGYCSYITGSGGSHAEGYYTYTGGNYGVHSEGYGTYANGGGGQHAEGYASYANGSAGNHAEGYYTNSDSGYGSHAEGYGYGTFTENGTTYYFGAHGTGDHSEGYQTYANSGITGTNSGGAHAEGHTTKARNVGAHAEGRSTTASGTESHAEGYSTIASGSESHAEGYGTTASAGQAHAEGSGSTASGSASHAEGAYTTASESTAHAEGAYTIANSYASHAEGYSSQAQASYAHAEGSQTTASGLASHAEGQMTSAGVISHAEGYGSNASGNISHAEGYYTTASGLQAHAEGYYTIAAGSYSHTGGSFNISDSYDNFQEWTSGTSYAVGDKVKRTVTDSNTTTVTGYVCKTANSDSSFTQSKWTNLNNKMNYAEIIGNGEDENNRSNARALDWNGNERLMGDVYVGCNADSTGGIRLAKITEVPDISGKINITEKGAVNGVAELGSDGKVPSSQLPSYVDDVLEYANVSSFPVTGENGKIYIALDTNKTYRWSGTTYVAISSDLALGETSSTAYRGDRGKIAYDHSTDSGRLTTAQTSGLYKIATTQEGHVASVAAVVKSDITALGIPSQDTTYSDMTGASASTAGAHGLVPAPEAGDEAKFLRGDGTWATVASGGPSTAFAEYDISIATTDWSATSPYNYTWQNASVISNSLVDVYYRNGANLQGDLQYEKVSGGVQFTVSELPSSDLPLKIRVISNTEALVLPDMTGATSSAAGVRGLVPAPLAGDQSKFLKGDGTWGEVSGLPAVTSSDNGKIPMVVNGVWTLVAIDSASGVIY